MAAIRKPQWAVPSSHEAGRQVDDYTGTRPSNVLLGAAGVHYVIARLLRNGLIGTATPTGTPNIVTFFGAVYWIIFRGVQRIGVTPEIGLAGNGAAAPEPPPDSPLD